MDMTNATAVLALINTFIETANDLLPGAIALGREIIDDIKGSGANVGSFADEEARFHTAIETGMGASDAWYARHGLTPPAVAPPATSAPAAGSTQPPPPPKTGT